MKTAQTEKIFADIKAGDRVWAKSGTNISPHEKFRLKTVAKVTPARIVLDGSAEFNTYTRNGIAYGRWMSGRIDRIATAEECAEWDAGEERKRKAAEDKQSAEETRKAKMAELCELFSTDAETNKVYVTNAAWTDDQTAGKFDITFHGLTEEEIRAMAMKVRGENQR